MFNFSKDTKKISTPLAPQIENTKTEKCMALLRIQKDISEDQISRDYGIFFPNKDNLLDIRAFLHVKEGFYKDGIFDFQISVPTDYPFKPPKVTCLDTVFHPNIDTVGHVCMNILRLDWKPIYSLNTILMGLVNIFTEPNYEDPLNTDAAELLRDFPQLFDEAVKLTMKGKKFKDVIYSYTYSDKKYSS